ncbi:hypothetical protein EYM_03880 [Ignicoccus islandicus DSM 13165]|uniref:Metallo-beta-lactamase domain-containing protein n=1 Tax=Ignicoccus islandicus DSM 13165 TaxID=940295 RepID=A0A0U3FSH7_9CREN|nr:hypothetical protein EYM_03880 [Ignicoccus islandicus DSM 13165]
MNNEGQAFLIKASECNVIVDSGAYGEVAFQNMLYYGVKPWEVEYLVNTHAHVDRTGGDWLFHKYGVSIAAGEVDAEAIQRGDEKYTASDYIGIKPKPVPVGWRISSDLNICEIEVILTPGHTAGSLSVYFNGTLLAGDALGPLCKKWGSDERAWLESLRKLLQYEAEVLCVNNECFYGKEKVKQVLEKSIELGPPWLEDKECKIF